MIWVLKSDPILEKEFKLTSKHLQKYLDFAIDTTYQAGRLTLGYFQTNLKINRKADTTPVTEADIKAEALIRARINQRYPDHAILGEELGNGEIPPASHRWLIDPIDGTKSFIRGIPLYAVLLALEIEANIAVGVAYFPALDEMVYAASGQGCYWNGRPARVASTDRLNQAYVSCTDPHNFARFGKGAIWERFKAASYYRVSLPDAYGHALVATGRIELMFDPIMSPWDCGPFPVILREAGGYFGDWSGKETIYANEGLSTSRQLLPEVLGLIQYGNSSLDDRKAIQE